MSILRYWEDKGLEVSHLEQKYFQIKNRPPPPDLPANMQWLEILDTIEKHRVIIISGSTGCGKSTQIPQRLLEVKLYGEKMPCHIVVTQPRRIAAISIARTVCQSRQWDIGSVCGYQVGMERAISMDTCLEFVTTNTLVERILFRKCLDAYSHVIVDEVHERTTELDILLYLLKRMSHEADYKIILMSATLESNALESYFHDLGVACINIEGSMHSVKKVYLDSLSPSIQNAFQFVYPDTLCPLPDDDVEKSDPSPLVLVRSQFMAAVELICDLDALEKQARTTGDTSGDVHRGAVLIFLPGLVDIQLMINSFGHVKDARRLFLVPLHSRIPLEDQTSAFTPAVKGWRKVIVATNIAESSITVPDIRYVVDFCLSKIRVVNDHTGFECYHVRYCSKASCDQRAGRAGRVRDGIAFRLVHQRHYETFSEYTQPNILRESAEELVLQIKKFGLSEPKEVLKDFITPPCPHKVSWAIIRLKEMLALQLEHNGQVNLEDGELTVLGRVMSRLPLDIRSSKLICLGFALGCFEECVKIAACLGVGHPFTVSSNRMEVYKNKLKFTQGLFSDLIVLLHVFEKFLVKKAQLGSSNDTRSLREWTRKKGLQYRRLLDACDLYGELQFRLLGLAFKMTEGPNVKPKEASLQNFLVLIAISGAYYPNYYVQQPIDFEKAREALGKRNPLNTMVISGLPQKHGPLYAHAIRAALQDCLTSDAQLSFEGSDLYLSFTGNSLGGTRGTGMAHVPIDAYLCRMFDRLNNGIELPRIDEESSRQLLECMNLSSSVGSEVTSQMGVELREVRVLTLPSSVQDRVDLLGKRPFPSSSRFLAQIAWWDEHNVFALHLHLAERLSALDVIRNEIDFTFGLDTDDAETSASGSATQAQLNDSAGEGSKFYSRDACRCDNPDVGELVLAEFQDVLYRAVVVSLSEGSVVATTVRSDARDQNTTAASGTVRAPSHGEEHKIRVLFLDFGNTVWVDHVIRMPPVMLNCRREPPLAYPAQLAHVQSPDGDVLSANAPGLAYKLLQGKPCLVELFSIVDDVLRIELYVDSDFEQVHINEQLRQEGVAVLLDEPEISLESHHFDFEDKSASCETNADQKPAEEKVVCAPASAYVVCGEAYVTEASYSATKLRLSGPSSPLTRLCSLSPLRRFPWGRTERVIITSGSVNEIMFGQTGDRQQFVVAHAHRIGTRRPSVHLLSTTLMPSLNLLLPFVALVFTPRAEYICNDSRTAYVGALCGLGGVEITDNKAHLGMHSASSACPESDIRLAFTHELQRHDVIIINRIRALLNETFRSDNELLEWTARPVANIRERIVKEMLRFFNKTDRQRIEQSQRITTVGETEDSKGLFRWTLEGNSRASASQTSLFRLHPIVRFRNAAMVELLESLCGLMRCANPQQIRQVAMCPICGGSEVFGTKQEAWIHLRSESHKARFSRLRGYVRDDDD